MANEYTFDQIAINSKDKKKPEQSDFPVYLGLENLDAENLYVTRFNEDAMPSGEKLIMRKGDVLFGKRRAYQKKVAIAPFDGIFSAHGMVLRPKTDVVDTNFFPFFISSDYFLDRAISISVGSLSPTVNWGDLKTQKFNLPSLDEQRKLAKLLWKIDSLEHKYRRLIDQCDELIKAQFVEMFGDNSNYVPFSSISLLGPQNGFYRKDAEIGGSVSIVKMKQLFANEEICNAKDCDKVSLSTKELKRFALTKNDLLFGRRSLVVEGAGKCSRTGDIKDNMVFESSILRVTLNDELVIPQFLQNWFKTDEGKNAISSIRSVTTIAGIKGSDLGKLKVPLPTLVLQQAFVAYVQQIDQSKESLKTTLSSLQAVKKNILQSVFV